MEKLIGFLIYGSPFLLLLVAYIFHCIDKPLLKKKCPHCGRKDRDWSTVPVRFDEFAWKHNCQD